MAEQTEGSEQQSTAAAAGTFFLFFIFNPSQEPIDWCHLNLEWGVPYPLPYYPYPCGYPLT